MTELGEKIFSLCAQGRTTKEIVDLCGVSGTTARKYRRRYREKHPGGALTLRNILPKATKKDTELWQQAVTAWEIAQIRAEIRVGDKIPLRSVKVADPTKGTESTHGRRTTGIVVSTSTLEWREGVRLVDGAGNAEKSTERSGGEESMMFFAGVVVGIGVGILSVIVTLLAVADREERKK